MRKRIISFVLVLVIAFTGAFSCFASADEGIISKYFNFWKKYAQSIDSPWDVTSPGFYTFLVNYLTGQKDIASNQNASGGSHIITYEFFDPDADPLIYSFGGGIALFPECDNCSFFVYVRENESVRNLSNLYISPAMVYFIAVPNQYIDSVLYSFGNGYHYIRSSQSIPYFQGSFSCDYKTRLGGCYYTRQSLRSYTGTELFSSREFNYSGHPEVYDNPDGHSFYCEYTLFNDFTSSVLTFSTDFSVDSHLLDITLHSNRDVLCDIDGLLAVTAGIIYDDGIGRMYAGSYFDYGLMLDYFDEWHFSYNLDDFADYAYRKRCDLDGYYGFVAVMNQSGDCIYAAERPLFIDSPGGIFDDVEDPPPWDDYKPDPSPAPDPPDITFNFTSNTNYQSISNITIDSNTTFNDYFSWVQNTYTAINNNINLATTNIINYGNAVGDYINNGFNQYFEYIVDSFNSVGVDLINFIDAVASYIGDVISTLNLNTQIIIDNFRKFMLTLFVPDEDVVDFILSDCIGWYNQIQSLLSSKNYESSSFTINFPMFDYTFTLHDSTIVSSVKTVARLIILACTALTCIRIGFQTFGINVGGGDNDS
jgi:hypothetical protein